MATASMLCLTLHYQQEIAWCDQNIASITSKRHSLLRETTDLANEKQDKKSEVSQDDVKYEETIKEINAQYRAKEKELKDLDEQMDLELNDWQTKRAMAEQYKNSFQQGLQSGIASDFTPFPGQ